MPMNEFVFRIFLSYRSIFLNKSYVTIQFFTLSYTVYHKITITPPDLQKMVSHIAATWKSDICEAPMEMLGFI